MPEVVYFAKRQGLVKIGTTGDLRKRMAELNKGISSLPGMSTDPVDVLAAMPGGRAVEQSLRQLFASLRFDNEWFFYEPPLTDFVEAVAAAETAREAYRARAGFASERVAETLVTLRAAVDRGLLPWKFDAAKKRLQRARAAGREAAPAPAGRDGQADLYRVGDLIEWIESELVS